MENISEEYSNDDDYGAEIDKEIATELGLDQYVDELQVEEMSDEECRKLTVDQVIEFKNNQILSLRRYIRSLEAEKRDLTENYKRTTDSLIEKIKTLEFKSKGVRPETARIASELKTKGTGLKTEEIKRCTQCTQLIESEDFLEHSLSCLRHTKKCLKCNASVKDEEMYKHLREALNEEVRH